MFNYRHFMFKLRYLLQITHHFAYFKHNPESFGAFGVYYVHS